MQAAVGRLVTFVTNLGTPCEIGRTDWFLARIGRTHWFLAALLGVFSTGAGWQARSRALASLKPRSRALASVDPRPDQEASL
eukprot:357415-Chlamydomonas_euryale.AAC.16